MAEGLFRAHNGEEKTGLTAASAGLYTENGLPASANAVAAAGERGADISAHRSRQLTAEMAENAKYLVCMTGSHYERQRAALAEIERACFHAPWSENMLREELGKGIFLVAEQDGRTAGYVGCQTVLDEGYITNVAVSPDFRRQGIARALIAELTAKAGENKLAFVTLEVRESNAPAIALYTGAGFAPVGKRKNFYSNPTENAVLMTISLI